MQATFACWPAHLADYLMLQQGCTSSFSYISVRVWLHAMCGYSLALHACVTHHLCPKSLQLPILSKAVPCYLLAEALRREV